MKIKILVISDDINKSKDFCRSIMTDEYNRFKNTIDKLMSHNEPTIENDTYYVQAGIVNKNFRGYRFNYILVDKNAKLDDELFNVNIRPMLRDITLPNMLIWLQTNIQFLDFDKYL